MKLLVIAAIVGTIGAAVVSSGQGTKVEYSVVMQGFHLIPGTMTADAPSTDQSGIAIQLEMTVTFAPISSLTVTKCNVSDAFFTTVMSHPIYFRYKNGIIEEIFINPSVPEQMINFQRGLVSSLQVPLGGHLGRANMWERDVLGDCQSTIVRSDDGDDVVVLKTKETHKCTGRPKFTTLLPTIQYEESKTTYGKLSGEYRLAKHGSGLYVQSCALLQSEFFAPMSKSAGSVVSACLINVTAIGSPQTKAAPQLPEAYQNSSLVFSYYSSSVKEVQKCDGVPTLLEALGSCHPSSVPSLFIELVRTLRTCSQNELKVHHLKYGIKKEPLVSPEEQIRTYFLDSLTYVGTEAALAFISKAVEDPAYKLAESRKRELINSIALMPFHYTSPCVTLSHILQMATKLQTWQTPSLALGSVINSVLNSMNEDCSAEVEAAVKWLIQKLETNLAKVPNTFSFTTEPKTADKQNWEHAVHAIKSLGNAGSPSSIPALMAALKQKKLLTVGRSSAVHALKRIAKRSPNQVRQVCLPIVFDVEEDDEVRIAAFSVIISSTGEENGVVVPRSLLINLLKRVSKEPKMNVKSHMCRMLTQMRTTSDPYLRYRKEILAVAMKLSGAFVSCAVTQFPCFSSSYLRGYYSFADLPLPHSLPRDIMGAGFRLSYYTPSGRTIPNNVYAKITGHAFGYYTDILEVGVRGTGIDQLINLLFGPVGYFRLLTRDYDTSHLNRPEGFSMDLESLKDNITVSGLVKMFGNELAWNHNEQPNIMRLLFDHDRLNAVRDELSDVVMEKFTFYQLPRLIQAWKNAGEKSSLYAKIVSHASEITKIWNYLTKGRYSIDGGVLNVTKTGSFMDIKRTVPTILGFPLNLTAVGVGHFGMDAEGCLDYFAEGWGSQKKDRFEMTGSVSPRLALMSEVNVTLDAYYVQPKLVLCGNATSNFTQRGIARLFDNYTLNVQLNEMPENENLLINSTYDIYVQKDAFKQSLSVENRKTTTLFDPFGDNILGIMAVANISFPYYKGTEKKAVDVTPWFPLSGPANMSFAFQRVAPVSMLNITIYNATSLLSSNGTYNACIEAIGTPLRVTTNISWMWNQYDQRFVNVCMSTENLNNSSAPRYYLLTEINTTDFSDGSLTREAWINTTLKTNTHWNNMSVHVQGAQFNGSILRREHTKNESASLIKTLTDFSLYANGSVSGYEEVNVSMYLYNKWNRMTHYLHANASMNLTHANLTVNSTLFKSINVSYCFASEMKRAYCHVFGDHFITFDGLKYQSQLNPKIEYVLTRHRHPNDTFGITLKGENVLVYLNGTIYTLTPDGTQLLVDGEPTPLPYEVHRTMHIRKIENHGQTYLRLSAFAGIDIVYNPKDVMISISRFFRNQTGGLCGNSNANGTEADELELPSYEFAESVDHFVSKWTVSEPIEPASFGSYFAKCEASNETTETCEYLFFDATKKAHVFVDVHPYYEACLCDEEESAGGYLRSLRAYVKAAHVRGLSLDGCVYGPWSDLTECENGQQTQTRSVLKNLLGNECSDTKRTQQCLASGLQTHPLCPVEKVHVVQVLGAKSCKSVKRWPSCGKCCAPSLTTPQLAKFTCVGSTDPAENHDNTAPVNLVVHVAKSCQPVENYRECLLGLQQDG